MASADGAPGFVLDTEPTENAVGVKTLNDILKKARIRHTVSLDERPVFKFGDGLSLHACSKVTLRVTALGGVHVLDGATGPRHTMLRTPRRSLEASFFEKLGPTFRMIGFACGFRIVAQPFGPQNFSKRSPVT